VLKRRIERILKTAKSRKNEDPGRGIITVHNVYLRVTVKAAEAVFFHSINLYFKPTIYHQT
jgi:hypothetical protein